LRRAEIAIVKYCYTKNLIKLFHRIFFLSHLKNDFTYDDFLNSFLRTQAIPTNKMRQNSSKRNATAEPKFLKRFKEEKPSASKY
jgi:hypothetical protein